MAENIDAERAAFITAYRLWTYEAHPKAHPEMVQFQAESHWGRAAGAMWLAARRRTSASIGEDGLPRLPRFPKHYLLLSDEEGSDEYPVFVMAQMAEYARQYAREAIAADRRAREVAPTDAQIIGALHANGIDTYPSKYGFDAVQVSATSVPSLRKVLEFLAAPPLSSEQQAEKGEK